MTEKLLTGTLSLNTTNQPTHQNVIGWVHEAQIEIQNDSDIISKAFKVTGISNALSGMEDHMVHNSAFLGTDDSDDENDDASLMDSGRTTFKSQMTPSMTWSTTMTLVQNCCREVSKVL